MKPIWIVENFTNGSDVNDLIVEIKKQGFELQLIGAKNHFKYDDINYNNQCIIFHGSITMTDIIKKQLNTCFPVVWLTKENYRCSKYYLPLKHLLFNDNHEITTVSNLKSAKFDYYRRFGKEAMIFIRPDVGDKTFTGQLVDLQYFDRIWDNNIVCNAKDDDLVIVSTPKTINGEWRFIVNKYDGIIAYSTYQYQGLRTYIPSAPQGAIDKCNEVLTVGYHPDSVYDVDICEDADGNFWLLEINSFSSAGMYECKKDLIVKRVSEIAEMEYSHVMI